MDDNTTQIILATIALLSVIATGIIGLFTLRATQKSAVVSQANSLALADVSRKVDGITTARVEAEARLGDAKAEVARSEGRDEEREKQEQKTTNGLPVTIVPTEVIIVNTEDSPAKTVDVASLKKPKV